MQRVCPNNNLTLLTLPRKGCIRKRTKIWKDNLKARLDKRSNFFEESCRTNVHFRHWNPKLNFAQDKHSSYLAEYTHGCYSSTKEKANIFYLLNLDLMAAPKQTESVRQLTLLLWSAFCSDITELGNVYVGDKKYEKCKRESRMKKGKASRKKRERNLERWSGYQTAAAAEAKRLSLSVCQLIWVHESIFVHLGEAGSHLCNPSTCFSR